MCIITTSHGKEANSKRSDPTMCSLQISYKIPLHASGLCLTRPLHCSCYEELEIPKQLGWFRQTKQWVWCVALHDVSVRDGASCGQSCLGHSLSSVSRVVALDDRRDWLIPRLSEIWPSLLKTLSSALPRPSRTATTRHLSAGPSPYRINVPALSASCTY